MSDISSVSGPVPLASLQQGITDLTKQVREAQAEQAAQEREASQDVNVFEKRTSDIVNDSLRFSRDIGVLVKNNSRLNVITNFQADEQADFFRFRLAKSGEIRLNSISQLDFLVDEPDDVPTGLTVNGGVAYKFADPGTVVAKLGAEDQDEGDTFTYTIVNEFGTAIPDSNFAIVDDELRVKEGNTLASDDATFHGLRIRVTDSGDNTYFEDVGIRVSTSRQETIIEDEASDEPVNFRIQLYTRNGSLLAENEGARDDLKQAFAELSAGTFEAAAGEYVVKISRADQDKGNEEIQYAIQLTQGGFSNDFDTIDQPFQPGSLPQSAELSSSTVQLLDGLNQALSFFGSLPPIGQSGSDKLLGALTDLFI